ncbi:MAG: sensor histidine kinase [Cytophagales bacterium]|nr:sensor histidine kinase [Cytophagales bacterium]
MILKLDIENVVFGTPRILWHLLFWSVFISFFALVYGSFEENYGQQFLIQISAAVIQAPAVYFTIYILMPLFLFQEHYANFFTYLLLTILFFSILSWFNHLFIQIPLFWPEDHYEGPIINIGKMLKFTTYIYPVLVLAMAIKWFKFWYLEQKNNQLLAKEKLQSELNFLKAQVHPHFLFNTLNNLYALTLKQSKDAPGVVLKLSDLLDYMLYECNAETVALSKEIKLVENYISLEKMRYGKRLEVVFNKHGELAGKMVAPLLILPFVENCFKHGVSEELDQSWVNIELSFVNEELILKVENSKSTNSNQDDQFKYKEGIGLKNVRRRLELIYPEKHSIKIMDSEESFLVNLKIQVDSWQ